MPMLSDALQILVDVEQGRASGSWPVLLRRRPGRLATHVWRGLHHGGVLRGHVSSVGGAQGELGMRGIASIRTGAWAHLVGVPRANKVPFYRILSYFTGSFYPYIGLH